MSGRLACYIECVPDLLYVEPDRWRPVWLAFIATGFLLHLLTAAWLAAYGTTPGEDLLRGCWSLLRRAVPGHAESAPLHEGGGRCGDAASGG